MKSGYQKYLTVLLFIVSGLGYIIGCTHDNEPVPAPASSNPVITRGTNIHLPGAMTAGNPNEWMPSL